MGYARFRNYLTDRKQVGVIEGSLSRQMDARAGVPQGSIIGHMLFLIYIKDIVMNIGSSMILLLVPLLYTF